MKNKIRFLVSVCIVLSMLSNVCFATPVAVGSFYNTDVQYTPITQVRCYSEGNFSGTYDAADSTANKVIMYAECKGGVISQYITTLQLRLWTGHSDTDHTFNTSTTLVYSNFLSHSYECDSNDIQGSIGRITESCYKISDRYDEWEAFYAYRWRSAQCGWEETSSY